MNDQAEAIWRKALQAKGKDWVMAQLRLRPGQPNDILLDVVYREPFPTRAFCQHWCADEENRVFRFSWHTVAIVAALIVFVICGTKAIDSRNEAVHQLSAQGARGVGGAHKPAPKNGNNMANNVANNASNPTSTALAGTSSSGRSGGGGSGASSTTSAPSVCAYLTYPTPQCGNSTYFQLSGPGGTTSSGGSQTTSSSSRASTSSASQIQ